MVRINFSSKEELEAMRRHAKKEPHYAGFSGWILEKLRDVMEEDQYQGADVEALVEERDLFRERLFAAHDELQELRKTNQELLAKATYYLELAVDPRGSIQPYEAEDVPKLRKLIEGWEPKDPDKQAAQDAWKPTPEEKAQMEAEYEANLGYLNDPKERKKLDDELARQDAEWERKHSTPVKRKQPKGRKG